jgi:hypothetical protein
VSTACTLCGETTFCRCLDAECRACNGEGSVEHPFLTTVGSRVEPGYPVMIGCEDCSGTGWIKCDRGGVGCRFSHCYCEAAWEAQNERLHTEEPPLSADERHRMAWREKQIAKGRMMR